MPIPPDAFDPDKEARGVMTAALQIFEENQELPQLMIAWSWGEDEQDFFRWTGFLRFRSADDIVWRMLSYGASMANNPNRGQEVMHVFSTFLGNKIHTATDEVINRTLTGCYFHGGAPGCWMLDFEWEKRTGLIEAHSLEHKKDFPPPEVFHAPFRFGWQKAKERLGRGGSIDQGLALGRSDAQEVQRMMENLKGSMQVKDLPDWPVPSTLRHRDDPKP